MERYTTHIKSKNGWFDIDIAELLRYKDLVFLFVKRNYTTRYKQTILGPLWLVFNPLITVALYALVFGKLAGLSTEGVPQIVFYLCSNVLWSFFSTSIIQTSNTFTSNASIMSKVYFPRLVIPISSVITALIDLAIQMFLLSIIMLVYFFVGYRFNIGYYFLFAPLLIFQTGVLGLGFGIIIAALTTKYRDLAVLIGFGVQLWMYVTPVVYSSEIIPEKYINWFYLNPMAPIMENWRKSVIGAGVFVWKYWIISMSISFFVIFFGIVLFSKIEKNFMDTV